ncbi:hypothetical protein [Paenibacillus spongiae]|uniref:Right-handed parallel beta-helix repeat-containing protein n=1 Tax=Paenibacillus spongiae TaxID=2909671 RepID=A0ABY5SL80_9BACL|nr:hypothetical protein [Paenibacillus spongiae]UVI33270.1 hypothetical protein L1F29_16120 [Paenibacillus spongiae]
MADKETNGADYPEQKESSGTQPKPGMLMSRRKLLASLGAAGVVLASEGLLFGRKLGVTYGQDATATGTVYGGADSSLKNLGLCITTTVDQLRITSAPDPRYAFYVTDAGREGFFLYDAADTTTADNNGTVLVSTTGRRFKRVFGDTLLASWFGTKGDGVTVDTQSLQSAINAAAGRKLIIPKHRNGYYLTGQLYVPSDTVIEFAPGTVVQAIDTLSRQSPFERLIRILNVRNVHIIGNGATLQMNKAVYTTGEQAHIFDISGSENVVIERVNANDSGGDGFYVGAYQATQLYCKNIVLRNCTANNNRRQGLSVISVDGFLAENCSFNFSYGTSPKSGVDIEPNSVLDLLKRIRFVGCSAEGNVGRGFLISLQRLSAVSERVDITFENCRTKGNSFGSSYNSGGDGAKAVKGEIRVIDCVAENEQYAGYSVLSNSQDSVKTTFIRCRAVNCNTVNQPDDPYGFGSSFIVTTVPQQARAVIGNVEYYDCESIDERNPPLILRGFTTKKNANELIRGVKYVNCSAKGGTQNLYYIDPAAEEVVIANLKQPVTPIVFSGPVGLNEIGCKITNTNASGDITLYLLAAKAGYAFTFFVDAAYALTIAPQAGASILTPAGSSGAVSSANPGDTISLLGRTDGNWEITNAVGGWFGLGASVS